MDGTFEDFVNQQAAKVNSSGDWIQERDNWIERLNEFYQLAESFLSRYVDEGKIRILRFPKHINEEFIGSYEVPSLDVQIGAVKVRFDPIGTYLIGAKGRVDMHGPHGSVKFVLVPKPASAPTIRIVEREASVQEKDGANPVLTEWAWKISTPPPNISYIELEEESFLSAIMEVANA